MTAEIRPATETDFEQIAAIRREAFRRPSHPERWNNGSGRVLATGSEVQGIVRTEKGGQYFGRRRVRSCALTSVAVAVPYRNQGVARRLLGSILREEYEHETALAPLFPSSLAFYRKLGFEFAGTRIIYSAPAVNLPADGGNDGFVEQWSEWSDKLLNEVIACYQRFASTSSGLIDRSPTWWGEYVTDSTSGRDYYCHCVYDRGGLVAYAIYYHEPRPERTPYDFVLRVRDMAWTSGVALQRLYAFLSSQWPYQLSISWPGPAVDPVSSMFTSSLVSMESNYPWMARIINVEAALRQRGYPQCLNTSVRFTVVDSLIAANNRSLFVSVLDGVAEVANSCCRGFEIDINTLTALYTGWLPAQDAARMGLLREASAADVQALTLIFSGPSPWIPEFF
jgi:predicted acetyltransferase